MTVSPPSTPAHSEDSPSYKTLPCHSCKEFYTVWLSLGSYKNSGCVLARCRYTAKATSDYSRMFTAKVNSSGYLFPIKIGASGLPVIHFCKTSLTFLFCMGSSKVI